MFDLFDTSGFTPRWFCGVWPRELGWLHIVSDVLIFAAYFAIPLTLAYFVVKRRDVPYPRIFILFMLFIASCGMTHLVEAWIFYWPTYRLSGAIKAVTAVVSWLTVFALIPAIPKALRLPGLERVNTALNEEISQRSAAEAKLKQLATQLETSNRDLEQFAYIASHDLQEPLRKIEAYVSFAIEDAEELSPDMKQHLDRIENSAGRMRQLINDLLSYSRVDRVAGNTSAVDLQQVMDSVLDDSRLMLEESEADLQCDPLPTVDGVAVHLRQVFANLVSNAVKFRSDARKLVIEVRVNEQDGDYLIKFSDNGIGFAPEFSERIFEPFQRLHTKEQYPGNGIGLAICQRIVRKHGGDLTATSELGVGSTFLIRLPKRSGSAA